MTYAVIKAGVAIQVLSLELRSRIRVQKATQLVMQALTQDQQSHYRFQKRCTYAKPVPKTASTPSFFFVGI